MKSITFARLVRDFGPVFHAEKLSKAKWFDAVKAGRFATVYHGDLDWITPVEALVRHHGCANTICKIAWSKPLPKDIDRVIGMRESEAAFALVNEEETAACP